MTVIAIICASTTPLKALEKIVPEGSAFYSTRRGYIAMRPRPKLDKGGTRMQRRRR